MSDPWLTILGIGEDGAAGLSEASRAALAAAKVIVGPPRHLALIPEASAERVEWPVPFADGLDLLESFRGRPTVALASGDPFRHGAGAAIARRFEPHEWTCHPAPSAFALAAARLGWAEESCVCAALHAAPLERLVPDLATGVRVIATLRDGGAAAALAAWLTGRGWGASTLTLLERLGGPSERVRTVRAEQGAPDCDHPLMAAIEVAGNGTVVPHASGRPDALFETDGQITKRPVRALALSALAPRPGEILWDVGAGSGSVGIEWLLSHSSLNAVAVEARADRAARIACNAATLGVERLRVVEGRAPEALMDLPAPDAVFVGGGLSEALLDALPGARVVAHAVTLESEALLTRIHAERGGSLLRVELSAPAPLGPKRGWRAAYPVTQWSWP